MSYEQRKELDQKPLGEGCTNSNANSCVNVEVEAFTLSVFFDGTGNNRFNVEDGEKLSAEKRAKKSTGFQNYYSNIALLWFASEDEEKVDERIYIEGAGTFREEGWWHGNAASRKLGAGAAQGDSGIETRVEQAITETADRFYTSNKGSLILNVYGFSRGAAYARYFCHQVHQNSELQNAHISINFVGLFDTVSSYGTAHYNNVKALNLDIGKAEGIRKIVHFTAENDYRKHFPLTPIVTAVNQGIGFECSFPGAHSDIGGGYVDNWTEINYYIGCSASNGDYPDNDNLEPNFFINKGYYKEGKTRINNLDRNNILKKTLSNMNTGYAYLYVNRLVRNGYQFIFADLMKELMLKETSIIIDDEEKLSTHITQVKQDEILKQCYNKYSEDVLSRYEKAISTRTKRPLWIMDQVYNKYIHNSLDSGAGATVNAGTPRNKLRDENGKLLYDQATRPIVTVDYKTELTKLTAYSYLATKQYKGLFGPLGWQN